MHQIKALLDSKLKLIDALFIDDCFERCVTRKKKEMWTSPYDFSSGNFFASKRSFLTTDYFLIKPFL